MCHDFVRLTQYHVKVLLHQDTMLSWNQSSFCLFSTCLTVLLLRCVMWCSVFAVLVCGVLCCLVLDVMFCVMSFLVKFDVKCWAVRWGEFCISAMWWSVLYCVALFCVVLRCTVLCCEASFVMKCDGMCCSVLW